MLLLFLVSFDLLHPLHMNGALVQLAGDAFLRLDGHVSIELVPRVNVQNLERLLVDEGLVSDLLFLLLHLLHFAALVVVDLLCQILFESLLVKFLLLLRASRSFRNI